MSSPLPMELRHPARQSRRYFVELLLILIALSHAPNVSARSCDEDGVDAAGIRLTQSKIYSLCPCDGERVAYEHCVVRRIDRAIAKDVVPRSCRPRLMALLRHTRCGRPGAVTCCRTGTDGTTRAFIARDAAACRSNVVGGQACISGSITTHGACWAHVNVLRGERACVTDPPCGDGKVDPEEDFDAGPLTVSCASGYHFACLFRFPPDGQLWCTEFTYGSLGATERFGQECRGAMYAGGGKCSSDRHSVIPAASPNEALCCQRAGECADDLDTGCASLTAPYGPWSSASVARCGDDGQCHPRPRTR